jgi:hypothetical protein
MKISIKLLDSNAVIGTKILSAIISQLQPAFTKTQQSLQQVLPKIVKEALILEPEYASLLSGQLRSELGIPDADSKIDQIFNAWSNNVVVQSRAITMKGSGLSGGFSINVIKSDFSDVLSLPASVVVDSVSGSIIPWLQWLLLEGNQILIRDYKLKMGSNPRSRTGNAIMVSSTKDNWRVPPQFAGTINNNWVTRAIDRLDDTILSYIEKELERHL